MGYRKLTQEQIDAIPDKRALGMSDADIAMEYGVSVMTIYRYRNPENYARQKKQTSQYRKENRAKITETARETYYSYLFQLRRCEDADVIEKLRDVPDIKAYLCSLVRRDIAADGSAT